MIETKHMLSEHLIEKIKLGRFLEAIQLIGLGVDVRFVSDDGDTPLHTLCEEDVVDTRSAGDVARVLLAHGASATALSRDYWTPLHVAATRGKVHAFRVMVEVAKPNMDVTRDNGFSVLHSAVIGGEEAIVELAIAGGANVNLFSEDDGSPLHVACQYASPEIVRMLVDSGAVLDAATDEYARTPMQEAHSDEVFLSMLEAGADPHAKPAGCGMDYLTPFQQAVTSGYVRSVQACIERPDTNIEQKTLGGQSLIDLAEEGGSAEVRQLVLSHLAEVSVSGAVGETHEDAAPTRRLAGPDFL